ncbi:hypothetical protein [Duncaniella dubosii]|uniref:hypothetical protein n=1 Tax=Duncaniella dubosii TaxID=2518971 RepID=UPI003F66AE60
MRQVPAELAELYQGPLSVRPAEGVYPVMMYARDNGIMQSRITVAARQPCASKGGQAHDR